MWEIKIKSHVKREVKLQQNLTVMFNVALGQYGADMLSRVDSSSLWETMNRSKHAKGLVEVINPIVTIVARIGIPVCQL